MREVKELAQTLNVMPKLRLAIKISDGNFIATGPHHVRFSDEPIIVTSRDRLGREHQDMIFFVDENGTIFQWSIPVLNKKGHPHYLIEKLVDIEVGDVRTLEMIKGYEKSYIEIRPTKPEDMPDFEDPSEAELEKVFNEK